MAASKPRTKAIPLPPGLLGVILESLQGEIDEQQLRDCLGRQVARSHAELARIFGVSANTIRQSWVPAGMPGKSPNFDVIAIMVWRAKYEADLRRRQPGTTARSQATELRELEIESKRLTLQRQQRIAAMEDGDMIERHRAEREIAALVSVTRERLLRVASLIEPMLPAAIAVEIRVEIEKQVRRQLLAMSEMAARDILNEAMRIEQGRPPHSDPDERDYTT